MEFITSSAESELLAVGEVPYSIADKTEFEVRDDDGVPTGQLCRVYRVDRITGLSTTIALSERVMSPAELDAVEMRGRDGSVMAVTYGEFRRNREI